MKDREFKFNISISREGYKDKAEATKCLTLSTAKEIGKTVIAFKEESVTVDELIDKAVNGYAFCYLFKFEDKKYKTTFNDKITYTYPVYKVGANKGYFKIKFKSKEFFRGTQTIFVDIDNTTYEDIYDYVDSLTYKPTALYCSYSDRINKGGVYSRRFRLVYVFDEVLNPIQFEKASAALYNQIKEDTEDTLDDRCWLNSNQYYNGGNTNEVYKSYEIYNYSDIVEDTEEPVVIINYVIDEPEEKEVIPVNKNFIEDMSKLDSYTFKKKWSYNYKYIYKTTYTDYIDGLYQFTDDNYYSLYWNRTLIKDGQHRRKKLLLRANTRRKIKPEISVEELIYNMYIDRERIIDNSDGVITNEYIISTCISVMRNEDEVPVQVNKPKFVVNHTLPINERRKVVGKVRGIITDNKIGEIYDTNLTVTENLKVFEENGIDISKSTVYNFCKKHDINTKHTISVEDVDFNKSIRENLKILQDRGIKSTYYQVQKIIKQLKP